MGNLCVFSCLFGIKIFLVLHLDERDKDQQINDAKDDFHNGQSKTAIQDAGGDHREIEHGDAGIVGHDPNGAGCISQNEVERRG